MKLGAMRGITTLNGTLGLRRASEDAVRVTLARAEKIETDLIERLELIEADPKLSAEGRTEAKAVAAKAALDAMRKWHAPLVAGLEEHGKALRQQLRSAVLPPVPSDPAARMVVELRHQEIRAQLAGLSAGAVEILYQTTTDPTVRGALTGVTRLTPQDNGMCRSEPWVSRETVDSVLINAGAMALPGTADELHDALVCGQVYGRQANGFVQACRESVPEALDPSPIEPLL